MRKHSFGLFGDGVTRHASRLLHQTCLHEIDRIEKSGRASSGGANANQRHLHFACEQICANFIHALSDDFGSIAFLRIVLKSFSCFCELHNIVLACYHLIFQLIAFIFSVDQNVFSSLVFFFSFVFVCDVNFAPQCPGQSPSLLEGSLGCLCEEDLFALMRVRDFKSSKSSNRTKLLHERLFHCPFFFFFFASFCRPIHLCVASAYASLVQY